MVAQISVNDDDEVAGRVFHSVHVCSSQAQFRGTWLQHDLVLSVDLLQILGHVQCTIRTAIVDDNDLVVEFAEREEDERSY